MASSGAPEDYSIQAEGMTIAVVYTRWNDKIVDLLRAGGTLRHKELLAPFGLDASDPGFWNKGLDVIDGFITELEQPAVKRTA